MGSFRSIFLGILNQTKNISDNNLLIIMKYYRHNKSIINPAMSVVVGLASSHVVWSTLETIFSHRSKSWEPRLKDELQHMKKDARSILIIPVSPFIIVKISFTFENNVYIIDLCAFFCKTTYIVYLKRYIHRPDYKLLLILT